MSNVTSAASSMGLFSMFREHSRGSIIDLVEMDFDQNNSVIL